MNHNDATRKAALMSAQEDKPMVRRAKSWLLVLADGQNTLHFYDVKFDLPAALRRIQSNPNTKDYELIDILDYIEPDGAIRESRKIREVRQFLDHLTHKAANERVTPLTSQREPAQGQP